MNEVIRSFLLRLNITRFNIKVEIDRWRLMSASVWLSLLMPISQKGASISFPVASGFFVINKVNKLRLYKF